MEGASVSIGKRIRGGASLPCPKCHGKTEVVITRSPGKPRMSKREIKPEIKGQARVGRVRKCLLCGNVFETKENEVGTDGILLPAKPGPDRDRSRDLRS